MTQFLTIQKKDLKERFQRKIPKKDSKERKIQKKERKIQKKKERKS